MRLWTFQFKAIATLLKAGNSHYCDWRYVPSNWRPVYQFITEQMREKRIPITNHAPIWAWHSCNGWQKPPTLDDARGLLSDIELEMGVMTVEMEVPESIVLLSNYNRYCDLLFDHLDGNALAYQTYRDMFDLNPTDPELTIQATLPYISPEWVLDIRPLNLSPAFFEYDVEELV